MEAGGITVEGVELRRVALPLVTPFRTSFGVQHERDALLVRVRTSQGEGWGECVALADPHYSPEYVDGAQHVIRHHLLPPLFGRSIEAASVTQLLAHVKGHPMAKAALEMAVLDAELRLANRSLANFLGVTRSRVPSGVSVGIFGSIGELLEAVERYISEGYVRIKLKIEPGWDLEPVRAVRELFGDDLALQVDANTAYTLADADHLRRLDEFDLLLIEQPLGEDDVAGHAELARRIRTPVCLDESIVSAASAIDAIDRGACSVVNVKAGRVGGYLEAVRVHDACAARNVPVWCGGMLETGLGRAANIALAALPNFTLTGDVSASARFYERDITAPIVIEDGHVNVPTGPGLGVEVDHDALTEFTTSVEHVPRRASQ
ncbi:MAG TPA: o-succinylbenzoate synthase [Acidimicrobiales bacterium]|nr:o-succinylbenzoate synthase [Acidimicrobiales bacterium]